MKMASPAGGFQRQAIYLCKNHNRSHLYSATDSWYLNDAAEGHESQEYYYICNLKIRQWPEMNEIRCSSCLR